MAPCRTTVQEDIPYHFRKSIVCKFKNGIICSPATSALRPELEGPRSIWHEHKKDNFCLMTPIVKCKAVYYTKYSGLYTAIIYLN
jgi:hypothetical protein